VPTPVYTVPTLEQSPPPDYEVPISPDYIVPTLEQSPPPDYEEVNPAFNGDVPNYERLNTTTQQSTTPDYESI